MTSFLSEFYVAPASFSVWSKAVARIQNGRDQTRIWRLIGFYTSGEVVRFHNTLNLVECFRSSVKVYGRMRCLSDRPSPNPWGPQRMSEWALTLYAAPVCLNRKPTTVTGSRLAPSAVVVSALPIHGEEGNLLNANFPYGSNGSILPTVWRCHN